MTTQTKSTGNKPTHRAYTVSGEGKDATWTPIGAAWPNRDGNGFTLTFDAIPLSGRVVIRTITEKVSDDEGK